MSWAEGDGDWTILSDSGCHEGDGSVLPDKGTDISQDLSGILSDKISTAYWSWATDIQEILKTLLER